MQDTVAPFYADPRRQVEQLPEGSDPGPGADDHAVGLDGALIRLHGRDGAGRVAEPGDPHPGEDADALRLRFGGQPLHRSDVVGVAALLLVQHGGDAARPPVAEQPPHVPQALGLAFDEGRGVADLALLPGDRGHVRVHHLRAELHVAHRVVAERLGVALPDLDAEGHQLTHGRLEVVVADHAAGDAGGAGADPGLVQHDDALPAPAAPRPELAREVVGRAEPVDAGADDDVRGGRRHCNHR